MKLVLANNQSQQFRDFYAGLNDQIDGGLAYASYNDLVFLFNTADRPLDVVFADTAKSLRDFAGIYINGYLSSYELAASVAEACSHLGIPFVNQEMAHAPSLSKLTMHVKLAARNVSAPATIGASKKALLAFCSSQTAVAYPAILKRADADRGIDNFKVKSYEEMISLLQEQPDHSLWLLQQFIDNDGFYLISYYGGEPKFCIYRSLEKRPDNNEQKAHMFKPVGGVNAREIAITELDKAILDETAKAVGALDRQIGSVDCLLDKATGKVYVLEVNYNPQLVTIETLKEIRVRAFVDFMNKLGS